MEKVPLFNIQIHNVSMQELLQELTEYGGFVVTPNVDHMVKLQYQADFLEAYRLADFVVCDSKIIQYILKFLGTPIREKISGSDLFPAFYNYNRHNQNIKIYLLGAREGIAQQAQEKINEKIGRDIVVASYSPSFGFEKNEVESQKIVEDINNSQANVLAIGVGTPKQEKWLLKHYHQLSKIKVFLAIGATIDFEAGAKPRSPKWLSSIGLEWLYRLFCEPKRLWKRYLVDSSPFFWLVLQQKLKLINDQPVPAMTNYPKKKLRITEANQY